MKSVDPASEMPGTREIDDADLVRAFVAGDRKAFDALVLRHQDRVFNLTYWFLGDINDARDTAQDVFIKAFKALPDFRFEAAFSTWLYRIAMNTCRNRVKSLAFRLKKWTIGLEGDEWPVGCSLAAATDASFQASPENSLELAEREAQVRKAIGRLPVEQKTVVILRDMEGFSYEEISRITGLKTGTIKSRLFRARDELRRKLRDLI